MANLIIVCGPQAVGKMTVAESLRDKLRYCARYAYICESMKAAFSAHSPTERKKKEK